MAKSNIDKKPTQLIWRISPDHPHGVFILVSIRRVKSVRSSELHERTFDESSHDLLHGAEVKEIGIDMLPGALRDALTKDPGRA